MPKGSRLLAVDQPNGPWGRTDSEHSLRGCINELQRLGYDAHLFFGDSTSERTVNLIRALAPFDVVFIDANHTEPFVRKDFASYGKLARYCCFHDIGWNNPTPAGRMAIEVPKVWQELGTTHARGRRSAKSATTTDTADQDRWLERGRDPMALIVSTCKWGDKYRDEYLDRLKAGVAKHLRS